MTNKIKILPRFMFIRVICTSLSICLIVAWLEVLSFLKNYIGAAVLLNTFWYLNEDGKKAVYTGNLA